MADPTDDTTPLVAGSEPTPAASSSSLKWYSYLVLALIFLGVVTAVLSSVESLWKFIFVVATVAIIAELYLRHVYVLKPSVISDSFLVTQIGFGYFLAPLVLFVTIVVFFIVLTIVFGLFVALMFAIISAIYPDAVTALANDLDALSERRQTVFHRIIPSMRLTVHAAPMSASDTLLSVVHVAKDVPAALSARFSFLPSITRVVAAAADPEKAKEHAKEVLEKIWNDMVAAGASPAVMVIMLILTALVALFLFVVVGGLGSTAILEAVKFKLFKRHEKLSGYEPETSAAALGVKGLVFFAVTGTAAIPVSVFISMTYGVLPTFSNCFAFAVVSITDVLILCVSQVLVATAFAEHAILQRPSTLKKAFRTSVLFNFGLSFLRVSATGKETGEMAPSIIAVLIFGAIRFALLYKFGMLFIQRFKEAVEAETTSAEVEA